MKQYTIEYKNEGPVRVISTVCANNLEELQEMLVNGTFNPEIQDIQFDNPEGEYNVLAEKNIKRLKIDPITIYDGRMFENPPK